MQPTYEPAKYLSLIGLRDQGNSPDLPLWCHNIKNKRTQTKGDTTYNSPDITELAYPIPVHPLGMVDVLCRWQTTLYQPWEWERWSAAIAGCDSERHSECARPRPCPKLPPASQTLRSSALSRISPLVLHSSLLPAQQAKYLFPTDICYNQEPALFSCCAQRRPLVSHSQKSLWRLVYWEDWGRASFFPFLCIFF